MTAHIISTLVVLWVGGIAGFLTASLFAVRADDRPTSLADWLADMDDEQARMACDDLERTIATERQARRIARRVES